MLTMYLRTDNVIIFHMKRNKPGHALEPTQDHTAAKQLKGTAWPRTWHLILTVRPRPGIVQYPSYTCMHS